VSRLLQVSVSTYGSRQQKVDNHGNYDGRFNRNRKRQYLAARVYITYNPLHFCSWSRMLQIVHTNHSATSISWMVLNDGAPDAGPCRTIHTRRLLLMMRRCHSAQIVIQNYRSTALTPIHTTPTIRSKLRKIPFIHAVVVADDFERWDHWVFIPYELYLFCWYLTPMPDRVHFTN
jgi:hypothetical protein